LIVHGSVSQGAGRFKSHPAAPPQRGGENTPKYVPWRRLCLPCCDGSQQKHSPIAAPMYDVLVPSWLILLIRIARRVLSRMEPIVTTRIQVVPWHRARTYMYGRNGGYGCVTQSSINAVQHSWACSPQRNVTSAGLRSTLLASSVRTHDAKRAEPAVLVTPRKLPAMLHKATPCSRRQRGPTTSLAND